jgi:predicted neuraminidase
MSEDNGETWNHECILEKEQGEYSYPAIVAKGNEFWRDFVEVIYG